MEMNFDIFGLFLGGIGEGKHGIGEAKHQAWQFSRISFLPRTQSKPTQHTIYYNTLYTAYSFLFSHCWG